MTEPPLWNQIARRARIELVPQQLATLSRFLDLLLEANQRMNLTRITDRNAAEVGHVGDALTVLRYLPAGEARLADVGSGGGVPGIPLAIVRPEFHLTLIEATKKKASFLKETVIALALNNVNVLDERAEDAGRGELRESFDAVVVRAVATMDWLAEWCLPLVKKGGKMLAMKGPRALEELPDANKAMRVCGGGEPIIHPVELPGTDRRVLVEIPKTGRCDPRYPRPATQAKGKPIR